MNPGKRPVIIYGGSFDPPHRGHAALAAAALRQLRPSALYLVPGFRTPFKDLKPVPFADRKAMLLASLSAAGLGGRPEVKVSSFEAGLRQVVYTWETVAHFRRLHPGAPLYFLMGSDCLADFPKWRRTDLILREAALLVGMRPGHSISGLRGAPFTPLRGVFPRAASSDLRAPLFCGRSPRELQPAVLRVIKERGLYLSSERELLRREITPARYRHSLSVASLAAELAPAAGLPAQLAAFAGLVHDCARDMAPAALVSYALRRAPRTPMLRTLIKEAPVLLHAWAGAARAAELFGPLTPEIREAVELHATGAPGMGPLARLIYTCDLACPGRDFPQAAMVRELARRDLDAAFRAANYVKLVYAFSGGGWVHPLSVELWNSLQEKKNG